MTTQDEPDPKPAYRAPDPTPGPDVVPIGTVVTTSVPTRLDRLDWSPWHRRVVIALGVTWILDGLEAALVSSLGDVLARHDTLNLTPTQIGQTSSIYLAGQVFGALLFGHLTDTRGRKKLFLVTLFLYLAATALSGLAPTFLVFALFRFLAGAGIGGEYAAINSAIDELIPARVRGQVDLTINGSYWIGVLLAGGLGELLLNPALIPPSIGWRLVFGLGAILGLCVILVRRDVPESPRWLLMHGYVGESVRVMDTIEAAVLRGSPPGTKLSEAAPIRYQAKGSVGFLYLARDLVMKHTRRTILGLSLVISQAFFYNAIFFSYGLILTRFYNIPSHHVGRYMIPFAIGNFLGPALLGRFFDSIGRRRMIAGTYGLSGVLLTLTGYAFSRGWLSVNTQVLCWCFVFFFASSAASSAYLTVSELFPVEVRGKAIAMFYAIGTGLSFVAPTIFARLVASGSRVALFQGYLLASGLMIGGSIAAAFLAENAEGKSLEQLADATEPT